MPDLLLELGAEELPASAVRRAYTELGAKLATALVKEAILDASVLPLTMGTPRRLIVNIIGISARQKDSTKEQRGPGVKSAYDSEGKPTPALLGFCRGQGIDPSELRQDGQYVWVTKQIPGRDAKEILSELIPTAIRSLTFDKTMRWGSGRLRFARPIRWILATFDGEVVPCELEGVQSGNHSFGHRFYAPDQFIANTYDVLLAGLRERHVEPDPARRREMILDSLPTEGDDQPQISEALLDENVFLTEWPTPILGSFQESFLELPTPVLTTVMAKHEKMFPVNGGNGEITSKFIFVRNSGQDASVRKGCEWVLNARMNDAKFFFDEDRRLTLDDFLEKTKGVLFQEKLGTVHARAARLSELAVRWAPSPTDSPNELEFARLAGKYAKADLSTGLVSELASLQGVVGGIYARKDGLPEEVARAIACQYDAGKWGLSESAKDRTALRLVVADQLDKLAGFLGIGLEPSGSSDPFGLRRAAIILIDIAWVWPEPLQPYSELLEFACDQYVQSGIQVDRDVALASLGRMFEGRYSHMLPQFSHDVLEAALTATGIETLTSPKLIRFKAEVIDGLSRNEPFVQAATRPLNILSAAQKKGFDFAPDGELTSVDRQLLDSASAETLYELAEKLSGELDQAFAEVNASVASEVLLKLESPINRFFEETMVIAEDPAVRRARLTVVNRVCFLLIKAGDFTKIVFKG